jgi:uncharacterized protein (UPF0335 family)
MVGYARLGLPAIEGRSAMKTEKAIQVLRDFNLWRRGDEEMEQPDQYTIGEAIDDVLMAIDNMEEEIDAAIEAIDNMEEESKKLRQELIEMAVYADKLAAGFPEGMLPKDMEVLREANLGLATEVAAVTEQRDRLVGALELLVTTDHESKDDFITRVKQALAAVKGGSDE